jgi:hypothetical protein
MQGSDTLYVAPVAVGSGDTLSYRGQRWQFDTPRGRRVVQSKMEEPVWRPPLWHYVRFARENGYALREMAPGETIRLSDGSRLVIRNRQVGRVALDGTFTPIPQGEQIIFDETVFAPPFGTLNREVPGELGAYRLDLGNAYLIPRDAAPRVDRHGEHPWLHPGGRRRSGVPLPGDRRGDARLHLLSRHSLPMQEGPPVLPAAPLFFSVLRSGSCRCYLRTAARAGASVTRSTPWMTPGPAATSARCTSALPT